MTEVEKIVKARKIKRAVLEDKIDEVEAELDKDVPDILNLDLLCPLIEAELLFIRDLDEKIMEKLMETVMDDDSLLVQAKEADAFVKFVERTKVRVHHFLSRRKPDQDYAVSMATSTKERKYRLPKIEISKFSGEHLDWLNWWSQFKKIHEDDELDPSDKFQYLKQSITHGSRAHNLVNGYPITNENYPKVISALMDRYGDKTILTEIYVRQLIKLIVKNARAQEKKLTSKLYDELESHLRSLESLGVDTNNSASFLYPLVESSLPEELLQVWQRSPQSGYDDEGETSVGARLNGLMKFLKREVKGAQRLEMVKDGFESEKPRKVHFQPRFQDFGQEIEPPTAAALFGGKLVCVFCEKNHNSQNCFRAREMTIEEKRNILKAKRCCWKCFRAGHFGSSCQAFGNCNSCDGPHHPTLCTNREKAVKKGPKENVNSGLSCSSEVILQTFMVKVRNGSRIRNVRGIVDNGSQRSYILKKTATELGIKPEGTLQQRHILFGGATVVRDHGQFTITIGSLDGSFETKMTVLDEQAICHGIPRMKKGPWMSQLKQKRIQLSDVGEGGPPIEILIGADQYNSIATGRIFTLRNGLTAYETKLGWTVMGKFNDSTSSAATTSMLVSSTDISQLWSLELIGIRDPTDSRSLEELETLAREQFLDSLKRNHDGRYSVGLPWIGDKSEVPTNRPVAESRLRGTTRKLENMNLLGNYTKIFDDWETEGIIEEVVDDGKENCFYLPHHPVFKLESKTTPIRPVFDASCKSFRTPSLNQLLHKGPNLLEKIPAILNKFREKKIGVISDIRKAFQMIEIQEEDRNFLRFLWWDKIWKRYKIYRHKRVVFGVNSSPFLLAATLDYHLNHVPEGDLDCAQKLLKSLYVDNCVTSVCSMEEYEEFQKTSVRLLNDAQFELREWEYGPLEPGDGSLSGCGLGEGGTAFTPPESTGNVLGYKWNKSEDTLSCDLGIESLPIKMTKRIILSHLQKVFDPVGFTVPALLQPKILLQKAWAEKLDWDSELPEEFKLQFRNWNMEVGFLAQISIPRLMTNGTLENCQLHLFTDASKDAYAAVVYIRTGVEGQVNVQLVQAKSRVSPLKKTTIPRLELLGCVIGSRLLSTIQKAFPGVLAYCWSDSSTALAWIKRNDDWGTFVGNRVKEICTLTEPELWKHVPGRLNPADLPSRGCSPKELKESIWWEGPKWLKLSPEHWPIETAPVDEDLVGAERKKTCTNLLSLGSNGGSFLRFGSYWKNVRLMGWIMRFVGKCRKVKMQNEVGLSLEELEAAQAQLWKLVQREAFSKVGGSMGVPTVKIDGLLRVKTKLLHREDSQNFKMPIVLPNKHGLVDQLIRHYHEKFGHAGVQFLIAKIREEYWILQTRRAIGRIVSSCVICRRFNAKCAEAPMAALPADRVRDAKAFQTVGVDLCGPLYLKDRSKVWIVLYTCAVYRCVHLELTTSLNTEEFLLSLSRFVSRRGTASTIYSDNGRNFLGAANLFANIDWDEVEEYAKTQKIKWVFIPPTAAWWGGFWERLIRSLKDLLKRMLGHGKLDYVRMETVLLEAESILNSRPLTFVTENPEDLIPLTPAMFFQDNSNSTCAEFEALDSTGLNSSYKKLIQLKKELRSRFRSEYLGMLVQHAKEKKLTFIKPGDVVIIGNDLKKRLDWPLAVITELVPGKDGISRCAWVKTANGKFLRPIQRLFPLEVHDENFSKEDGVHFVPK